MKKAITKTALIFIFLFVMACGGNKKDTIVLEGEYSGKNLFVQNPYAANGVGFCVSEVYVNGKMTSDEINSENFEIDLTAMALKEGDKVKIEINHLKDCAPKILNPEVLK